MTLLGLAKFKNLLSSNKVAAFLCKMDRMFNPRALVWYPNLRSDEQPEVSSRQNIFAWYVFESLQSVDKNSTHNRKTHGLTVWPWHNISGWGTKPTQQRMTISLSGKNCWFCGSPESFFAALLGVLVTWKTSPYAPCMEYWLTFGPQISGANVANIPAPFSRWDPKLSKLLFTIARILG